MYVKKVSNIGKISMIIAILFQHMQIKNTEKVF